MKETYWVLVYVNETPFDVAKYKSFFIEEESITKETLKRWKETLLRRYASVEIIDWKKLDSL